MGISDIGFNGLSRCFWLLKLLQRGITLPGWASPHLAWPPGTSSGHARMVVAPGIATWWALLVWLAHGHLSAPPPVSTWQMPVACGWQPRDCGRITSQGVGCNLHQLGKHHAVAPLQLPLGAVLHQHAHNGAG